MTRFTEGKCSVSLPGPNERWICISGSKFQKNHDNDKRLCDLSLLWDRDIAGMIAVALELKGGGASVEHVKEQLQGGANLLNELTDECNPTPFVPVLVHNRLSTMQMRRLAKVHVNFKGKRYPVKLLRCGKSVLEATEGLAA
ncbi:hypothetical protein [Amycolatopsis sp. NPDC021455]|uniref:hypothetical protein n=1 Tax=Amycolatopsis sp. NPDC021455 TaxID=3154901 RepID=UPI0033D3135B